MKKTGYVSILSFLLGFGLFIFTRTTTFIPIASAIAPIFILYFLRTQTLKKGIVLTLLGFTLALQISLWGLFDVGNPYLSLAFNIIRNFLLGLILALPYIADRLIGPKIKGFASTLVFAVSATAMYFLDSIYGPFDGIMVFYAYMQYGNAPLMQLLSIASIWGLVFLLSWFASVICWAWINKFDSHAIRKGSRIFSCIAVALLIFGGAKIAPFTYDYEGSTVRVAAAVFHDDQEETPGIDRLLNDRIFSPLIETIEKLEERTELAAKAGAKFIVFQEYAFVIPEAQEETLLAELKRIAKENDMYITLAYASMPALEERERGEFLGFTELSDEEKGENKSLLIDNHGEIEAEYVKHNLATGEGTWIKEGPGIIPVVDTPYGRVAIIICRDMEFPNYMRQASEQNADIVMAPSYEAIPSLTITYGQMLRTIEGGFSFVRATNNGLSVAADYNGQILSSLNFFTTSNDIMYADVPTKGVRTLYTYIGDVLAWLCVLGFVAFVVIAIKSRDNTK